MRLIEVQSLDDRFQFVGAYCLPYFTFLTLGTPKYWSDSAKLWRHRKSALVFNPVAFLFRARSVGYGSISNWCIYYRVVLHDFLKSVWQQADSRQVLVFKFLANHKTSDQAGPTKVLMLTYFEGHVLRFVKMVVKCKCGCPFLE